VGRRNQSNIGGYTDPYSTHLEALTRTAVATQGDILELGCGNYSTPQLQAICEVQGRGFKAQASNAEWASQFDGVEIVDWNTWEPPKHPSGKWGMVFLDSEEAVRDRIKRLPALAEITNVVVMHDANIALHHPDFKAMAEKYRQVIVYNKHIPWTAVLLV